MPKDILVMGMWVAALSLFIYKGVTRQGRYLCWVSGGNYKFVKIYFILEEMKCRQLEMEPGSLK